MQITKHRTKEEFQYHKDTKCSKWWQVEQLIAKENKKNKYWYHFGYCEFCKRESKFLVDWEYSDGNIPNFRERLLCEHCGLNNRQRFTAGYFRKLTEESNISIHDLYIYEQITNFYSHVTQYFWNVNIIGSEYLGYDKKPGETIKGLRHEDALSLSFQDKSFDIIISNDVYEHVPDVQRALNEAYRVLRDRGKLIFTVPFHYSEKETKQRAILENGKIIHLLPEIYHGNPVSEKGSLVFNDFGWDLLAMCVNSGFSDAYVLTYFSHFYGYLGSGLQFMFVAEK